MSAVLKQEEMDDIHFYDRDWPQIRREFPILDQSIDGYPLVYLDSAASSQAPHSVINAVSECRSTYHSNVHRGVHTVSQRATDAFELARTKVANFIGASREECIFVKGATEGINLVAYSYLRPRIRKGDDVLLTTMEHHANIVPWQMICQEVGATLNVIPISSKGEILLDDFNSAITPRTKIVGVTHISNVLGTVNPISEIVAICHAKGVPVLVDGCQAVPRIPVNVKTLDADFYVFSGHKVCGPTGVGVLYGRRELLEEMPPFLGGGQMIVTVDFDHITFNELPHKFEAGTPAIAEVIGLGSAIDFLENIGMQAIAKREDMLLEYCLEKIAPIKGIRLFGTSLNKAAIVSFLIDGVHHHDAGTILNNVGVAVRVGHHCAQPLMRRFGIEGCIRASFAFYNDESDIDALVRGLDEVVSLCC